MDKNGPDQSQPLRRAPVPSIELTQAANTHLGEDSRLVSKLSVEEKDKTYEQYQEIKKEQTGNLNGVLAVSAFGISLGLSLPHGFNTGVLNPQELHVKEFLNDSYVERFGDMPTRASLELMWSLVVSIYLVGGMAGSLSFGAGSGLSPLFLTEIAPVNIRGAMGVLHQLMLTVGILVSQLLGLSQLLGQSDTWPYLCALVSAPCLFCLAVVPFIPDSPRYLVVQLNDENAAEKALKKLRKNEHVSAAMLELRMDRRRAELQPPWTIGMILKEKNFRLPLLLVVGVNLAQQLSGINVAFYYSHNVLKRSGIPLDAIQYAVIAIGAINVAMTGVSVALVEKFGRKLLLLVSHVGMFIAACLLTVALNAMTHFDADWMAYVAVISLVSFVVMFASGLGCIPQFLGSELFLTGPRPAAMALAAFGNWLGNLFVGLLFPFMAVFMGNWCFVPFLLCLAASFVFLFIKLPETKGRTPDDMAALFGTDYGMPKISSRSSNMLEVVSDHLVHIHDDEDTNNKMSVPDKAIKEYIASQNSLRKVEV
uniref:MFS domain-containing protein n=1 Tax=Macrostomum lignano TaxID=282301 RepID=A0A1I8FXU8_9PLAT